jgi:hypothetical protein
VQRTGDGNIARHTFDSRSIASDGTLVRRVSAARDVRPGDDGGSPHTSLKLNAYLLISETVENTSAIRNFACLGYLLTGG